MFYQCLLHRHISSSILANSFKNSLEIILKSSHNEKLFCSRCRLRILKEGVVALVQSVGFASNGVELFNLFSEIFFLTIFDGIEYKIVQ
ncbi:unnamed protein product [Trifolium pratense]|uniref:Uncharacterized protein n=1 Tax=Trifolium pratense TaxID=57577 RepID=A0ACB0LE93_TRIPR|nr:unnamed protein product [Trifolium pratense]